MKLDRYLESMSEKPVNLGPRVRAPVKTHLDQMVKDLGGGHGMQKLAVEAAILAFASLSPKDRKAWIMRVRDAEMEGGTTAIVREIKAKYSRGVHETPADGGGL